MKKWVLIILRAIICIIAVYGIMLGIFYLKIKEKSERELWRITDYSVSQPVAVNDLFIFSGHKADRSIDCGCIYAANKSTGEIVWSAEEIEKPYMELGATSSNSFSVDSYIEMVSPKKDIIYIGLYYVSGDNLKSALIAVRSNDGKLLWKVDGEVASDSFADSVLEKNQIIVFDEQGDLFAINSNTGKEVWRRKVYQYYDSANVWFRYFKDTVFTFNSQSDLKIKAFVAETGQSLWESDRYGSERWNVYIFNKTIYLVSPPLNRNKLVTAIDLETGKTRWDMVFPNVSEFSMTAGDKNEVLFLIKKYEGGPNNFHELAKLIVVDEFTGQSLWKFNGNFSHGDLHYRINGSTVYIGTQDGYVFSMDSTTGNVIWQSETKQFAIPFEVAGNALIVVYKENYMSVLDIKTGLQKWKLDLGVDESWSNLGKDILGVNSSTIFVAGNYNQKIYAIDINTGTELWSWNHFLPVRSKYEIELIDNILYVDQWPRWNPYIPDSLAGYDWYFALKAKP
jgi:outer membrane protein assembly factor BamB